MDRTIRRTTTPSIIAINNEARQHGLNSVFSEAAVEDLAPFGVHVLVPVLEHLGGGDPDSPVLPRHVRCLAILKTEADRIEGFLDVLTGRLLDLPPAE